MRVRWAFFAVIPALFLGSGSSSAQTYPSRNITAIIPFAAGNANDITARIVFDQLSKQLGQPIVIESRPGAGGTIGVGQAARATPDGYTILFHSATFSASYVTHKTLPYDTLNDFTAVSAVSISPSVPPAPGLLSITIGWPSCFCSCSNTMRAVMSLALPAANGMIAVMLRDG